MNKKETLAVLVLAALIAAVGYSAYQSGTKLLDKPNHMPDF